MMMGRHAPRPPRRYKSLDTTVTWARPLTPAELEHERTLVVYRPPTLIAAVPSGEVVRGSCRKYGQPVGRLYG